MRLLLFEVQREPVGMLHRGLQEAGFAVDLAVSGEEADHKARTADYDTILLSAAANCLALLEGWRQDGLSAFVMALTGDCVREKVRALDAGADDCLAKPFRFAELLARLRALTRRRHAVKEPVLRSHDLEIDTVARTACREGRMIPLRRLEYALLEFLAYHCGRLVTRTMIWEHLYGETDESTSNVVDVTISSLRKKIDKGYDRPLILTRRGEGYLLRGDEEVRSVSSARRHDRRAAPSPAPIAAGGC
jgi:DNA-binding response OmpR family regulator